MFLPVEFDDCVGNQDVTFEVSDPTFQVDGDLNLVPHQDVLYSRPVLFIHGVSAHVDDMAQVEIAGLPVQSPHTLRVSRNCVCVCVLFFSYQFLFLHFIQFLKRLCFIKD